MSMTSNPHKFVHYDYPNNAVRPSLEGLPQAVYEGRIVLVDTEEDTDRAVAELRKYSLLGIDTESKPNFVPRGKVSVALLQLASPDVCYLFRLNEIGIPPSLRSLLEDGDILKIGLGLHGDLQGLKRIADFSPRGFVELQQMAPAYGLLSLGLQSMYAVLCRGYISKKQSISNWEAPILSPPQLAYAALDAYACLEIYRKLMALPSPQPTQFGLIYL